MAHGLRDCAGQLLFDFFGWSAKSEPAFTPVVRPPQSVMAPPQRRPALPSREELQRLTSEPAPAQRSGFITERRVTEIFLEVAAHFRPGQVRHAQVEFKPFRSTLYSFKIQAGGRADCKLHVSFRQAGENVIRQAVSLMLCRSRRVRQEIGRAEYDAFVRAMPPSDFELPGSRKGRRVSVQEPGNHRSLEESFSRVNLEYFQGKLERPELCWSPVRARRILGSYHHRNDRLIVSRVFDSPRIPEFVLDYLMFHELLHKFLGIGQRSDGKRCVHGPEFRALEQRFRRFDEARAFLEKL